MKKLSLAIFFLILFLRVEAQQIQVGNSYYTLRKGQWLLTEIANGETYLQENGQWKYLQSSNNQLYPIVGDEIIIQYKANTTNSSISAFETQHQLIFVEKDIFGIYTYKVNSIGNLFNTYRNIKNSSLPKHSVIHTYRKYTSSPNDIDYSLQWYLDYPTDQSLSINIDSAWSITTGDSNVVVAVLDAYFDYTHEDLGKGSDSYENIFINHNEDAWANPNDPNTGNGIDDDGNGFIDDWKGYDFGENDNDVRHSNPIFRHGTFVSGIIGAKRNNNLGIAGIAGGDGHLGVKMLLCNAGSTLAPVPSAVKKSILYAIDMNVDIIQMSLWIPSNQEFVISPALDSANKRGIFMAAATGNDGQSNEIKYPASSPFVFAVGATDSLSNQKANFSNYYEEGVGIAAPGAGIYSIEPNNGYGYSDGTSFATPIVSGVAALMKSINPCLSKSSIEDILKLTADKVGGYDYNWNTFKPNHSEELGYGKLNAYQAVLKASQLSIPSGTDLCIKDSDLDLGEEHNNNTIHLWTSEDIWIRDNPDNLFDNEVPIYDLDSTVYVYVRVRNRGCSPSLGTEQLKLYWAKAGVNLAWPNNWTGLVNYPNTNAPAGGLIQSVSIPPLAQGEEVILEGLLPNPGPYPVPSGPNDYKRHFCLLARVDSPNDPMATTEVTNVYDNIQNNNNTASKNVMIWYLGLNGGIANPGGDIIEIASEPLLVGNIYPYAEQFDLVFKAEGKNIITNDAEVTVKLDDLVWQRWENNGKLGEGIEVNDEEKTVLLTQPNASLKNIIFHKNDIGTVNIQPYFFIERINEPKNYHLHLIQQRSVEGGIIGGELIEYRVNERLPFYAEAGDDELISKNDSVELHAEDIGEPAIYNWYNQNGELIYEGKDVYVSPDVTSEYELEVIALDGFKDYDKVQVSVQPYHIDNISPNPASSQVNIEYDTQGASSAYLLITSPFSNVVYNYILNPNDNNYSINIGNYQTGVYGVILICDGQVADQKLLTVQ